MKKNFSGMLLILILSIISANLGKIYFLIYTSILAIMALYELLHLRNGERHIPIEIEVVADLILVVFIGFSSSEIDEFFHVDFLFITLILLSSLMPLAIYNDKKEYGIIDAIYLVGSIIFIGLVFSLLNQYRSYNIFYLTYIFLIAYLSDGIDYISNRLIGKKRFIPTIPTKKTKESILSSFILVSIISSLFYITFVETKYPPIFQIGISVILASLAHCGNYTFAFMKNQFNKKNFSNIVLGKSGILDVMDSIIFVTIGLMLFIKFI